MLGITGVGTVNRAKRHNKVTKADARRTARWKVQQVQSQDLPGYSSWRGATIGKPVTFHAKNHRKGPDYVPSAYVFTVMNRGSDVGYVTISADRRNPPIMEFSNAASPSKQANKVKSRTKAAGHSPTGRKLYHGGLDYQVELHGGVGVNVQSGVTSGIHARSKFNPSKNKIDDRRVDEQWDEISERGGK